MLLAPVRLWCSATAPDLFWFKGNMNPPMCVWAFFVIELYQKIHQNIRTISACQLYFSKAWAVHKMHKRAYSSTKLFLFFFGAWLSSDPLSRTSKTSHKTGVPGHLIWKMQQWRQQTVLAQLFASPTVVSLSCSSSNEQGTALVPWSPSGRSLIVSHPARLKGRGCVYHKIALQWLCSCCWAS